MKIKGIPVGTPTPRSDWNQTDPRMADYIKNKPDMCGLGGVATYPPNDNLGEAQANGWYWTSPAACPDTPGMEYAVAFTKNRSAGGIVQELTSLSHETTGCQMIRFTLDGGANWKEEWVNPPMIVGVEYRTTERYNGKAVYKKLDKAGNILWRPSGEEEWRYQDIVRVDQVFISLDELSEFIVPKAYDMSDNSTKRFSMVLGIDGLASTGMLTLCRTITDDNFPEVLATIEDSAGSKVYCLYGTDYPGEDVAFYAYRGWEWDNPPMMDGVEYRTTERHNGKCVYIKKEKKYIIPAQILGVAGYKCDVSETTIPYDGTTIVDDTVFISSFGGKLKSANTLMYIDDVDNNVYFINAKLDCHRASDGTGEHQHYDLNILSPNEFHELLTIEMTVKYTK